MTVRAEYTGRSLLNNKGFEANLWSWNEWNISVTAHKVDEDYLANRFKKLLHYISYDYR
ncbi:MULTISPECIES: hypothetical protein [Bacillus cereus group]|uniref:hypothetical protein n=1 Tax=Bacillus cereus group TaxID=86661 RepID=UPI0015CEF67F|nr:MULTISPECIES: hypothetical protein [Bacillus cereus group]MBY0015192.1 hypothetical protein [Bacillus cereus]MDA2062675.1 hypothetical protein [Bacillus cereus]